MESSTTGVSGPQYTTEPSATAANDASGPNHPAPAVLVLGSGIAGIQSALNLAEYGLLVYLVDDSPTIGGIMARLNKTFPTNDCSICIEAPMMYEVVKNPLIKLLTYTELKRVTRLDDGRFEVRLRRKPRFVDEQKCKGCGKCVDACPVTVAHELDGRIGGSRKLISIPIPQAVPNVYVVDNACRSGEMRGKGACIGGCEVDCIQCRECQIARCVVACRAEGAEAVVLWQREQLVDLTVAAIIVATGLEPIPTPPHLFGFGDIPDVLTHLEFERLTNAAGPSSGAILKPSDRTAPRAVAWIQCAGRDTHTGFTYCSRICCMAATKQAIITKEHDPDIDTYIFYTDLQAYGKGFHQFQTRAEAEGVRYIRGRPAEVRSDPVNGKVLVKYEDVRSGEILELPVDILVLSVPLQPPERLRKLARILKLPLDRHGFITTADPVLEPVSSPSSGIFICGGALGPHDISESVTTALAASAKAAAYATRNLG